MNDEAVSGRKVLRAYGDVQMWQEHVAGPYRGQVRGQVLRYYVGGPTAATKEFATPHDAFEYFQELTGAPKSPFTPSNSHNRERGSNVD